MQKTLRIKNDIHELSMMNQFLEEAGEELGLSTAFMMSLNLVMEEAVSNIIFYAYKGDVEDAVDISLVREGGELIVTLIDHGIAFDPTLRKDPDITLSAEDRPIGGLGIFLIKKIMDEVSYQRVDERNVFIMKKKINYAGILKETGILTVAVAIIAAAVYFFLVPSHASVSSISGLGIVLANFIPLPLSVITMILNVVLLLIGFVTCGREFGVKTVYTSVMLPVFLGLFEILFPNFGSLTDSQELDVLCYILVVSVGLSILFNRNASSGGLDIVAKIMNKYLHMELGKAMSLSGMCVALSAALVYDKKTVVLSILGTYFNGIILDHFIFNNNIKRRVCIITKKEEELRQFITRDLHSGATIYEATGAYHFEKHNEIITIVDKSEYQKLMKFINELDPKAFITVYNVSSMKYQPKIGAF